MRDVEIIKALRDEVQPLANQLIKHAEDISANKTNIGNISSGWRSTTPFQTSREANDADIAIW